MQKALGRASALVVAVSILAIAFRAGTQTSTYMPVGPGSSSSSVQTPSAPAKAKRGEIAPPPNPHESSHFSARQVRILSVIPAPASDINSPPRQPAKEGRADDNPSGLAHQAAPAVELKQPPPAAMTPPPMLTPEVAAVPSGSTARAANPSPMPSGPGLDSGPTAKIVSLSPSPPLLRDKTVENRTKGSQPRRAAKPPIHYPDTVSPYHPAANGMPLVTISAKPKPILDEVEWRVIENPANKRRGLTSSVGQYFLNPAKAVEEELSETLDAGPEPEPVKREEAAPAARGGSPSQGGVTPGRVKESAPVPAPAPELQPPKDCTPAPVDTIPESAEPLGRLPEVLPESRPNSLVQGKSEVDSFRSAPAKSTMPAISANPPVPVSDSKTPGDAPAVLQAKYDLLSKESALEQLNRAAVTPTPAPEAGHAAPPVLQTSQDLDPEKQAPAPSMPKVIVPKSGPSQPTILPGHPSELNVHVKPELPARKIILIPQAPENSLPELETPKAAKVISVQAKSAAAQCGENSEPAREYPRQPAPPLEQAPVKVIKASIPEIIKHSHPQVSPKASIPEPKTRNGTIAGPADNLGRPRKLPASITDSPLVLGPACELLEATKAAAKSAGAQTPEAQLTPGGTVLPAAPEKALPAKTRPYLEKWLKDYIQTACADLAEELEITLDPSNRLHVHFRVKNDADAESLGRKIIDLPELAPYQVSLDITVLP